SLSIIVTQYYPDDYIFTYFYFSVIPLPIIFTLFPYTTLFRSNNVLGCSLSHLDKYSGPCLSSICFVPSGTSSKILISGLIILGKIGFFFLGIPSTPLIVISLIYVNNLVPLSRLIVNSNNSVQLSIKLVL